MDRVPRCGAGSSRCGRAHGDVRGQRSPSGGRHLPSSRARVATTASRSAIVPFRSSRMESKIGSCTSCIRRTATSATASPTVRSSRCSMLWRTTFAKLVTIVIARSTSWRRCQVKSAPGTDVTATSLAAIAVVVRGSPSMTERSPTKSPDPRNSTTASAPSSLVFNTFTRPSCTKNAWVGGSPSWYRRAPQRESPSGPVRQQARQRLGRRDPRGSTRHATTVARFVPRWPRIIDEPDPASGVTLVRRCRYSDAFDGRLVAAGPARRSAIGSGIANSRP